MSTASLCLLMLAACLIPAAWSPSAAARAASAAGCAAPNLNALRSVTVGLRPSDTAAGDFNADGRRDMVVANGGSTFVSLMLGSASGLFTATNVETGGATQVAVADFNNDGKDDIVVGRTQSIAVRLGDGAGGFGPLVETAVGGGDSTTPLVVADFNNDGNRDVFVGSPTVGSSKVMLGNGAGSFVASGALTIPAHNFADAGDFNGDGKTDLVLSLDRNFFYLVPGDGAGNFTQETQIPVSTSAGPIVATDLNDDGKLDVVTTGIIDSVTTLLGNGAGGFTTENFVIVGVDATAIDVADLNGDGKKDVVMAGRRGVVGVRLGDGAGGLGSLSVFRVGQLDTTSVVTGDFDGDNRRDVAAASASVDSVSGPAPGTVTILMNDAALGRLAGPRSFTTRDPFAITTGDLNRDGRLDLVAATRNSVVSVLFGNATTLFDFPFSHSFLTPPTSVTLADVSGDGVPDLLTTNSGSVLTVRLSNGIGDFGPAQTLNTAASPVHVTTGDFNLDGRADLAAAHFNDSGDVLIYHGNGAGTFGASANSFLTTGPDLRRVAVGDFNGDGRPDLAGGVRTGVALLRSNAAGGYEPAVTLATSFSVYDVIVGDFNKDGRPDLAAAHGDANAVTVFLGDDLGTFSQSKTHTVNISPRSVVAADLDGDGDADLATANTDGTVSLLVGDGAGDFAPAAHFISGGPAPNSLVAGDFNLDGGIDLAVANQGGNAVPGSEPPVGFITVLLNGCNAPPPALPRLTVEGGAALTEGDTGTVNATFTVRLSAASDRPVAVSHYTIGQTATSNVDFQHVSGRLTFSPGETIKTVTVPVVGDTIDEADETFALALAFPLGAVADGAQASNTITDDDEPMASLSVADVSVVEGTGGRGARTPAVFNVTLSAPSGRAVTVNYATANGTAEFNADYPSVGGVITFNPGETNKTITLDIIADSFVEPDETFFFNLSNPSGATIADAQALATIRNDDATVQLGSATRSATEGTDRSVLVTVARTGETSGFTSVSYATTDGTASERKDYTAALGLLRFAPGETSKTFEIVITDDRFNEPAETFTVRLSDAFGGEVGTQGITTVTINSNDVAGGPSPVKDASFNTEFFVRQHYADFLNRVPDAGGLQFWMDNIDSCGANQQCREVKKADTSAAFFLSIEFQETGFLAYRAHKAAFGGLQNTPVPIRLRPFLADSRQIGDGVVVGAAGWPEQLEANKRAYFNEFVTREDFLRRHPDSLAASSYVISLLLNTGVAWTPAEQQAAINAFGAGGTAGRAAALRSVAESQTLKAAETNKAFVLMQYFGYLRRNPDDPQDTNFDGYNFWLQKLNQFNGNYVDAEMVKAFIQSIEYGDRFGQ